MVSTSPTVALKAVWYSTAPVSDALLEDWTVTPLPGVGTAAPVRSEYIAHAHDPTAVDVIESFINVVDVPALVAPVNGDTRAAPVNTITCMILWSMLVILDIVTVRAADVAANATFAPATVPKPVLSTTGLHVNPPESTMVVVVMFWFSYKASSRLFAGAVNDALTQSPLATRAIAGVVASIAMAIWSALLPG
jgi:hypothetical protein